MQMACTCYKLYLRIVRLKHPVLPAIQLRTTDRKNTEIPSMAFSIPRHQAIRFFDFRQVLMENEPTLKISAFLA